jgi:hypothetical protein
MPKTEAAVKAAAEKMALLRSIASLSFKAAAATVELFVAMPRDADDGANASTEERINGRSKVENLMFEVDKGFEDCVFVIERPLREGLMIASISLFLYGFDDSID